MGKLLHKGRDQTGVFTLLGSSCKKGVVGGGIPSKRVPITSPPPPLIPWLQEKNSEAFK